MRPLLAALLTVLCGAPAAAQVTELTWDDPTFRDAVLGADLIVLAEATAVAKNGAAYRVHSTLKGPDRDGGILAVKGLHHPELRERPSVSKGDLAYLLLRGDPRGEGFTLPTPTLGRFTRRPEGERQRVIFSFGGVDTFVRVAIAPTRFEALVRGLLTGAAPTLLARSRATLREEHADPEQVYFALEALALFGTVDDAPKALAVLRDPRYEGREFVRVRSSACRALGHTGGARAAKELVKTIRDEPAPAVRSTAALMVSVALAGRNRKTIEKGAQALAEVTAGQDTQPIHYGNAGDPRKNYLASPFAACLRVLAEVGSPLGVKPALAALAAANVPAVEAGLAYFSALGDAQQAGSIARRMRTPDSVDVFLNRLFARTLSGLTGQDLGVEREAWLEWWGSRRREDQPLGPEERDK